MYILLPTEVEEFNLFRSYVNYKILTRKEILQYKHIYSWESP